MKKKGNETLRRLKSTLDNHRNIMTNAADNHKNNGDLLFDRDNSSHVNGLVNKITDPSNDVIISRKYPGKVMVEAQAVLNSLIDAYELGLEDGSKIAEVNINYANYFALIGILMSIVVAEESGEEISAFEVGKELASSYAWIIGKGVDKMRETDVRVTTLINEIDAAVRADQQRLELNQNIED